MIVKTITNKNEFLVYKLLNNLMLLIVLLFILLMLWSTISGDWRIYNEAKPLFWIFYLSLAFSGFFELVVKPAYMEAKIHDEELIMWVYNPSQARGMEWGLFTGFKNRLTEYRISREDFEGYTVDTGRLGFRKNLVLQKRSKEGITESRPINLCLLGKKKFRELTASLDRLKVK